MPQAPKPDNETERLAALHALDVLDSAPEAAFDDLARLPAHDRRTAPAPLRPPRPPRPHPPGGAGRAGRPPFRRQPARHGRLAGPVLRRRPAHHPRGARAPPAVRGRPRPPPAPPRPP